MLYFLRYHKTLKCKDVQNYSKTDLTCIFGRSQSNPELSLVRTERNDSAIIDSTYSKNLYTFFTILL